MWNAKLHRSSQCFDFNPATIPLQFPLIDVLTVTTHLNIPLGGRKTHTQHLIFKHTNTRCRAASWPRSSSTRTSSGRGQRTRRGHGRPLPSSWSMPTRSQIKVSGVTPDVLSLHDVPRPPKSCERTVSRFAGNEFSRSRVFSRLIFKDF